METTTVTKVNEMMQERPIRKAGHMVETYGPVLAVEKARERADAALLREVERMAVRWIARGWK